MILRPILIAVIAMGTIFIPVQSGAQDVVFSTFPIPMMIIDEDNGVFVELAKEVTKRAGLNLKLSINPPIRSLKYFGEGKADGFFPALDVNFSEGEKLQKSENIYIKRDFAFSQKGMPLLKTIGDLEAKKVGITRGYPYARELMVNKKIKFQTVDSDEINAKKAGHGRLDAFVVEEKTGIQAFKNVGLLDKIQYDPQTPLSVQEVYFAFSDDAKGKMLAEKISEALKAMKADGTLGKIMSKAGE